LHEKVFELNLLKLFMQRADIADIRYSYKMASLNEADVANNPFTQFEKWFADVLQAELYEANAMTLCTVNAHGQPHARTVLLKDITPLGFTFFTNYESEKGQDIAANNKVSIVFFWKELERQVCIEGVAQKISAQDSETYFRSRPFESQIGAIASAQSQVVASRKELEDKYQHLLDKYKDEAIPMPSNWGGYCVQPITVEFWQGRVGRLHDRLQYRKDGEAWTLVRLNP
jgi:pyridoxamine 5'-phosphate oxidase